MPEFSTITKKGQVTIPVSIRRKLGLKPKQRVTFVRKGDKKVEIKPVPDFFALRGSIESKKKYTDEKADKAVAKHLAKKHAQEKKIN